MEREQHSSMLSLTRALLSLRRDRPALHRGSYRGLESDSENCYVYLRQCEGERLLAALNFSEEPQTISVSELGEGQMLSSTHQCREERINLARLSLAGLEGCVIELIDGD